MGVTDMTTGVDLKLPDIILASSSPRRRSLMSQIGVTFTVHIPDIDETLMAGETPVEFVHRLSFEKASAIARDYPDTIVLGSDTIVVLGDEILGKPTDRDDAVAMLKRLSGNVHTVYTGYSLLRLSDNSIHTSHGTAAVRFRELDDDEIQAYVASGSPMDKAGSYGIQDDLGAVFVEEIHGDYYTIVGLPLAQVFQALRRF